MGVAGGTNAAGSRGPPLGRRQQPARSRGPSDFKAYIFPLLFYKRVSDAWDDEHARAVADFGADVTPEVEADYHRFQLPEGCRWRDLRKVHENVGVALQNILDRIQQANPDTLAGIFGDVAWGNKDKLPEHALLNLIEAFHTLDLSPGRVGHDVLGNAYEYLLKQFADESGKKAGEFFTPRSVVRLLTRILDPQPTDTVYDPACGSGGMLVEAANEVLESGGSLRQMRFYGQEVNLTTAAIARMNLFLHDVEDVVIRRGDTLRDPKFLDERGRLQRFDVVITNPPFSLKNWGAEVWSHDPWGRAACGVPPASNGDFAWVQHMLASMTPETGRVGVVMPHGVLFRGAAEGAIRECLLRGDRLDAVVGLAPNLFYSTGIPAALLIFRTMKAQERRGHVLFVDGSSGSPRAATRTTCEPEDVDALIEAYRTGSDRDGEGGADVRLVPLPEIEANGWDLNIGRYIKGAAADVIDVETALAELAAAQQALREAEQRLAERLAEAGYVLTAGGALHSGDLAALDIDKVRVEPGRPYPIAGVLNAGHPVCSDAGSSMAPRPTIPTLHRLRLGPTRDAQVDGVGGTYHLRTHGVRRLLRVR